MAKVRAHFDQSHRLNVDVVLSERNLLTLLSKLHIQGAMAAVTVTGADGATHIIAAQTDEQHYTDPDRRGAAPGPIHPLTEMLVAHLQDWLRSAEPPI